MSGLSEAQGGALRESLLALAAQLREGLEASAGGARPVDLDEPIGRVSRIDAIQQQSMARANRRASQLRLQQVEAALRRFERGEYGACLECGEEIGFARLEVRPESPFCLECQSLREARR